MANPTELEIKKLVSKSLKGAYGLISICANEWDCKWAKETAPLISSAIEKMGESK